jgi:hypothetical protein
MTLKTPQDPAQDSESPFRGPKKRSVWTWLILMFLMPFTAFYKLEKLFSDDGDPKDLDDDPTLGEQPPISLDSSRDPKEHTPQPASTPNTKPLDKA